MLNAPLVCLPKHAGLRRKLRLQGPLLVAFPLVRDLLLRANHLFGYAVVCLGCDQRGKMIGSANRRQCGGAF
jgi:hypothetical protein